MADAPRRWLLVYNLLRNGGIETLIVRLANRLAATGHEVAVVCRDGGLVPLLSSAVAVIDAGSRAAMRDGARAWLAKGGGPVAMVSFDPISTAYGLAIETMRGPLAPIIHIAGVYHQRAYFMSGERRDRILLNRLVAAAVGLDRLYFQNAECRLSHARRWNVALDGSAIVPLGIEVREPAWKARPGETVKLVSVGRLVDFKAYNLGAAEIARDCLDRGVEIRWDIYGTGPLAEAMAAKIARQGVAGAVQLKGALPYPKFAATVAEYDLFIGCGTSALEAAMLGLPVLTVTDSERRASYGFLDQLPFGNTGELQDQPPPYDLAALIADYAALDPAGRMELGRRCREAALGYSMDQCVERLGEFAQDAAPAPRVAFKRAVAALYGVITDSPLASLARRLQAFVRR